MKTKVISCFLFLLTGCGDIASPDSQTTVTQGGQSQDQNIDSTCKLEHGKVDCDKFSVELTCGGHLQAVTDASCSEISGACDTAPSRCDVTPTP